jgi:chorismate-pyruvate lyase
MSLKVPTMGKGEHTRLSDVAGAQAALTDLCHPFVDGAFNPECVVVHPDGIPYPADSLLVHHEHMTVVLQKHHGHPVDVHVMEEHLDGEQYTRKISLTPAGSDKVVEWGIVRLNFQYMSPQVREEILAKKMPLGAILIKHNVHRRIKPRYFLRFPENGQVLRLFSDQPTEPAWGRLGTIFCNNEPAIELLELVVNVGTGPVPKQ